METGGFVVEPHNLGKTPRGRVERRVLIDGNGSSDLIVALRKRGIGAGPRFGVCKALFDCLIPLGTGTKLLVEDMGLEEKFQPLLGIEAGTAVSTSITARIVATSTPTLFAAASKSALVSLRPVPTKSTRSSPSPPCTNRYH